MLQSMRENLKGVAAYLLVGLIIVVFGLSMGDFFTGGLSRPDAVAEVNGRKINEMDVRRAVEMRKQQLRSLLGENIDPRFLNDEFLLPSVRESVIQRELLISAAEAGGLRIGTEKLDKEILEDKTFHRDGKFDPDHYKSLLRQYAYTPASYRDELRTNQLLNQYQQTFLESAFVTEKEVVDLARLQFETRSFAYMELPLEKTLAEITATEAEVAAYYEQHKDAFMSEAQAAVEYILLDKQMLMASITVAEEEIRAQYEAEVAEAKQKTERHAAHILVEEKPDGSHQALLSDIQKKLAAGESFAALAKAHSVDSGSAAQGGDVGLTSGSSFVPEFEEALQKLEVGQVSPPVKTQFGYHIIKLLDKKAAAIPTLEQSRLRIAQALKNELSTEQYTETLEALREAADSAASLGDVASKLSAPPLNLQAKQTTLFSRKNPLPLFSSHPALRSVEVLNAVFTDKVQTGMVTDLLELNEHSAVVLRVTEYQPAAVQPLETVKVQAAAQLRRERADEQLSLHANELLKRLLAKESIASIAATEKVAAHQFKDKARQDAEVNGEILKKIFAMAKPAPDTLVADTLRLANGNWALVQVQDSLTPAAELLTAQQRTEVLGRLQDNARQGEFAGLLAMVTDQAKIVRRKQPEVTP